MITSVATIAAAITALIGVAYKINAYYKQKAVAQKAEDERSLEQQIEEATTNEQRAILVKRLADLRSH